MRRRSVIALGGALALAGAAAGGWRASTGSMARYDAWVAKERAMPPVPPEAAALVGLAALAPNGHNTQPWRFRLSPGRIDVLPDFARRTANVDPDDHHLYVSLGAAAETLAIAGGALGRPGELVEDGEGIGFSYGEGPARPDPLAGAIVRRQSTRADYDGRPLPAADLAALERAAAVPGVRLVLLTEPDDLAKVREMVLAGNTVQMADPGFVLELLDWLRFNPREAMARGDGLFTAASGNPVVPTALGRAMFRHVFSADAENDRYAQQLRSSAGCAVFLGDRADPQGWLAVGRACQRFALAATARDIRLAFVNQPVEVPALRPELAALAGEPALRPDLLIRFGRGPLLPYAPRRPVAEVMA